MAIIETKFQNGIAIILHILCILFFAITLFNCIHLFSLSYGIKLKYGLFMLAWLMIIMVFIYLTNRYLSPRIYLILLIIISFIIRYLWILNVNSPVVSDFSLLYKSALNAVKGDFSFSQTPYFSDWVYQIGFTMYEALIIKIFGEGTLVLKLLNALYSTGTTILVYKITRKIFNEDCGRIAGIIYALYIPSILMSSVLTNQHLATFLFYSAFYLLLKNDYLSKYGWMFIGILLSVGDIMRPLGSYILLAVVLFLLISHFLGTDKKQKTVAIKKGMGILVTFFVVHTIISQLFIATGVTQYPLSNRDPLWKFVLGFNHKTNGQYSNEDYLYTRQFPTGKTRDNAETHLIKERIANKLQLLSLFKNKLEIMWAGNDSSFYWSLGHVNKSQMIEKGKKVQSLIYITLILFIIISLIKLIKDKSINGPHLLFLLLIIGYVAVHLLIEIQTRYRYFIIPSFVILQSYGFSIVYNYFISGFVRKFRKSST